MLLFYKHLWTCKIYTWLNITINSNCILRMYYISQRHLQKNTVPKCQGLSLIWLDINQDRSAVNRISLLSCAFIHFFIYSTNIPWVFIMPKSLCWVPCIQCVGANGAFPYSFWSRRAGGQWTNNYKNQYIIISVT